MFAIILIIFFGTQVIYGYNSDSLWTKGNDSYSLGEWTNALLNYEQIEKNGKVSPQLYYNIGNTYFKLGNKGKAILYYERAIKLNPSYKDAINNLQIVSLQTLDKIEKVPEFVLITWIKEIRNSINSNTWAWLGIIFLVILSLLLLMYRFSSYMGVRKFSFILSCIMLFLVVASFSFSINLRLHANSIENAIVLSPVSNIKSAPNTTGNNLFILHEGTKLTILEDIGPWKKIELEDGRQGWIDSSTIEII
jgi:Bacterial SH3 domain./Tetratricopeptide repeat.